ncbi:T9SS type A sorting domain-containing protein [Myroides indicus]|uniref:Putative secreted protein (Por secretion system target) n=1 Tax=Myroides indicus TaxID=1323422 RepID=A0A4R7ET17_9FLAO|nr:T9SS type A sorting domain-containing protein [Myroides indicus]TDS56951.1 putative secreted protein (Por secretion system target) [Myroides indicus]
MVQKIFFASLSLLTFFCSVPVRGQKNFKDSHKVIWIKNIGTTADQDKGLNFHRPIQFSGDFVTLNKKYTSSVYSYVYYVLKSDKAEEKIFSLYYSGELHSFYTDKISSTLERPLDLNLLSQGAMVNFNFYNKNYKKDKKEGILYLENSYDKSLTELYEVLVCSSCADQELRNKIETYLAIKYGITLEQKQKYTGSDDRKVWDAKHNRDFNNRIIGIARDDYFGLEQTAGFSNTEDFFIVKRTETEEKIKDKTYVLVGDNAGDKTFDKNTGKYKRRWLVQNHGDSDERIDVDILIQPDGESRYFLHTSDGAEIENHLADTLKLSFSDIAIGKGQFQYLTLEKRKEFNFSIEENTRGINKNHILGVNEAGTAPFYITATDLETREQYFFVSENTEFELEDLPSARYAFSVKDAEEKEAELKEIYLDFSQNKLISLASNWYLQGNKMMEIKPSLQGGKKDLEYRWYFGDKLVSKTSTLFVNYAGDFSLEVFDRKGRKEQFKFSVSTEHDKQIDSESQWIVSPNPVNAGDEFTVTYHFESPKKVDFYIYTLEGKFVLRDQLGIIEGGSYSYTLHGKTTYLLIPIINTKVSTEKLIVK